MDSSVTAVALHCQGPRRSSPWSLCPLQTTLHAPACQWNSLGSWDEGRAHSCDVTELVMSEVLWKGRENGAGKGEGQDNGQGGGEAGNPAGHWDKQETNGSGWAGRKGSLGSQLCRAAFTAPSCCCCESRGENPEGSPGLDGGVRKKTPSTGRGRRRGAWSWGSGLCGARSLVRPEGAKLGLDHGRRPGPVAPLQPWCPINGLEAWLPGQSRVQNTREPADAHGALWRWRKGL